MPFRVTYDSKIDCVVTTITGDMDKKLITEFFEEVGRVATENKCSRILSDLRAGKIVAPITDIYEMAKTIENKKIQKFFRRAVVISKDHEDYAFWETACHNQGHQMLRIFQDYEQAKDWVSMK